MDLFGPVSVVAPGGVSNAGRPRLTTRLMVALLVRTMEVALTLKLIAKKELTRVIVDSTVQEKAVAHPTDSKLLDTARSKVVEVAKANGIELKQAYAKEGRLLGYKAGRYVDAHQFKRCGCCRRAV